MSGLYIHIPFCASKCIYCDFYSIAVQNLIPYFCIGVKKEIAMRRNQLSDKLVKTIYFGGGTPSSLKIEQIEQILHTISENYNLDDNPEITFEANPENLSEDYLKSLKRIGINRLSIGIQSFDDDILKFLKRRHSAQEAIECVKAASRIGLDNISIDLIYSISSRDNNAWKNELSTAFELPITHISCYSLGIEERTLLHKYTRDHKYIPANDDFCLEQFLIFDEEVRKNDFVHYEISNASKRGFESKHNSSYWNRTEYLGFGPSAHSYFDNTRSWNTADVKKYIDGINDNIIPCESEILSQDDIFEETIMLGLRTSKGINIGEIEKSFGKRQAEKIKSTIEKLNPTHYHFDGNNFHLTPLGLFISDDIIERFF